jgi:hypothetical protein
VRRRLFVLVTTLMAGLAVSAASSQIARLRDLMDVKLEHSQKILTAVATNDWIRLEQHSVELLRVAENPAWDVLRSPEYAPYSAAFLQATEDLIEAARERNLETAPLASVSLTVSCVRCHQHVGRMPL